MLNIIYYPVSGILWVWHKIFGAVLGADNGFAWALSVVFLVFTLRLVLYKPFVKQVRTTRQMQELQPQIKALQKKYGKDKQRLAVEMQKLQKEHGFNPIMGCLPVLAQAPVFIGLFHVLRSFNRTGTGVGQLGMSADQNANTANYFFDVNDVQSFLSARLFGAPISASITSYSGGTSGQLGAFANFGGLPSIWAIAGVSVPLMILASIATHLNSRASVARQSAAAVANPQSAIMNKLALYVFPLGVLVGGPFLPIAILLYWVSNNVWTYGQQHLVFTKIDKEEAAIKKVAMEKRVDNAPKPGARPNLSKKNGSSSAAESLIADTATSDGATTDAATSGGASSGGAATNGSTNGSSSTPKKASAGAVPGQKPKPGVKAQSNKNRPTKRRRH